MYDSPRTKQILVVEDDPDFRVLVDMMLTGEGAAGVVGSPVEITAVETGRGALAALARQPPDLVILDLALPDMNGWEVFVAMHSDARLGEIPVIILSSQGTRHDRSFGLKVARVHDYLTKPCLPSRLRASVAAALNRSLST